MLNFLRKKCYRKLLVFGIVFYFIVILIVTVSENAIKTPIIRIGVEALIIASVISICIIIAIKIEKQNSCIDPLTGLLNRKQMYEDMKRKIKMHKKFSIIFVDLNNFKQINDKYGHSAGDKVLENFGKEASKMECSNCYRIGGDEFIFLVPDLEISKDKKLQKFITSEEFDFAHGQSSYPKDSKDIQGDVDAVIEHLIALADTKMYKVKAEKKAK